MIEKQLKKAFDPYFEAPLKVWRHFYSFCEEVTFKKNQHIKIENTRARYGYFLLEGAIGYFIWNQNKHICLNFYFENSFFADDYSLLTGLPTDLSIIALENSYVLRISKTNIEHLKNTPIGKTLFLAGEQKDNAELRKHQMDLLTKTAEERYIELLSNRSDILQRISQKHIASYLGITRQSLSRIRRKISRND